MLDEIIGMLEENRDLEQAEIEKYRNRMNSLSIKEASKCRNWKQGSLQNGCRQADMSTPMRRRSSCI